MKTFWESYKPPEYGKEYLRKKGKIIVIVIGVLAILCGLVFFAMGSPFAFLAMLACGVFIIRGACWYYQKPQQKPKK